MVLQINVLKAHCKDAESCNVSGSHNRHVRSHILLYGPVIEEIIISEEAYFRTVLFLGT